MNVSRGKPLVTNGFGIDHADLPPVEQGRIDPRLWFDHPQYPLEVEIGSGKGTFLLQEARAATQRNFLGIERTAGYYRYAADRLRRHGIVNARMLRSDAADFLRFWCEDGVASVIHLYFSDPWPKKRHHKRRVLQDRMLLEMHRVLGPGGELRLVTDHHALWDWYEELACKHAHLYRRCPFRPARSATPGELVGTNYERKFAREGRRLFGMTLVKC